MFLFRPAGGAELPPPRRRTPEDPSSDAFADIGDDVSPTLEEALSADTQLQMDTWSHGRVTLVGDAGYCPGPAVGEPPASPSSGRSPSLANSPSQAATTRSPSRPTRWPTTSSATALCRVGRRPAPTADLDAGVGHDQRRQVVLLRTPAAAGRRPQHQAARYARLSRSKRLPGAARRKVHRRTPTRGEVEDRPSRPCPVG